MPAIIDGKDLKVGDVVDLVGGVCAIVGFEDHPGLDGQPARVMILYRHGDDDDCRCRCTLFDDDAYVRSDNGVLVPAHWYQGGAQ